MKSRTNLWKLYQKESIMIFKNPLIYIYILVLAVFVCNTNQEILNEPYDTKSKYEERLGYIPYEELQDLSEKDFTKKFRDNEYYLDSSTNNIIKFSIYEDHMSYDERTRLFETIDSTEQQILFQTYCEKGKIANYRVVDYNAIKSLSKEEYEKICHSLYVPQLSKSLFYFWNRTISNARVYPPYTQAIEMLEIENISGFIAREYYFRMKTLFAILTVFLLIGIFIKDYYNNILIYIKSSNIKSYQYILSKYLALTINTLIIFFILTWISINLMKPDYSNSLWTFEMLDFLKYFILLPLVTQSFLNAVAVLVIVISQDLIFSTSLTFYYIFLMGQPTYFDDGSSNWLIQPFKYFPRVNSKLGIMEQVGEKMIQHQFIYLCLTCIIILISIYIWEKNRIKGER